MPAGDGPVIRLENVHKTYDLGEIQVHALRGVSLEIKRGEFVAVMGASGSGKSTLMNILGCLDRPTKGRYFLDGTDVSQFSKVELADAGGKRIETGALEHPESNVLTVSLPGLAPGSYTVSWSVVSVDTHATDGHFTFTVKGS